LISKDFNQEDVFKGLCPFSKSSASIPKLIPYFLEKSRIFGSIKKSSFMNLLRNRSTSVVKIKL